MAGTGASTLDIFVLTFNCAKHYIDIPIFARHLYNAFGAKGETHLPELVVVNLQEVAPLSHAFIGGYFLNPYFHRFEAALNLAADQFIAEEERQHRPKDKPYTLLKTGNVGMTGIMLFSRDPEDVLNVQAAEVGFGAGDMSNKGAVGLRVRYRQLSDEGEAKETELTFVSAHLAAMEWNLERRNRNWESVARGLVFADPKKALGIRGTAEQDPSEEPLLAESREYRTLQDLSIYKPGTHLFVAGDLNYRLHKTSPQPDVAFPSVNPDSEDYYPKFLATDQLIQERDANRTLHGLSEAPIHFPPTYKYVIKKEPKSELGRIASEEGDGEAVQWTWAKHRWPGWCDRVLYLAVPSWARDKGAPEIDVHNYDAIPVLRTSDHRPVYFRATVPVLGPEELAPPTDAVASLGQGGSVDPRIKLPFPIDLDAWEHRAAIRRWEYLIGWSMMASKSKSGIMVFATVLLVAVGAWWSRQYFDMAV